MPCYPWFLDLSFPILIILFTSFFYRSAQIRYSCVLSKLIHTEHVLPLGRTLLALGEVSYTPVDGTISIGRSKTQPSVLSLSREDEFIDELSARANTHVTLGSILTLGGLATIAGATLFLPR